MRGIHTGLGALSRWSKQNARLHPSGAAARYSTAYRLSAAARNRWPNIFMLLLIGTVSSELMWIIRLRNESERLEREYTTQSKLLDRLIARAKGGETIDIEKELGALNEPAESVDVILQQLESMDAQWTSAKTQKVDLKTKTRPSEQDLKEPPKFL